MEIFKYLLFGLAILLALTVIINLFFGNKYDTSSKINVQIEEDDDEYADDEYDDEYDVENDDDEYDDSFYEKSEAEGHLLHVGTPNESEEDTDLKMKLLSYSDERLQRIISHPALYKAGIVETAKEILNLRKAWEQIKDLTDDELLELSMSDKIIVEDDIVEAASMELYKRDSQVLYNEFTHLNPNVVTAIANGTTPAPEGIRLAAQSFLNHRS